MGACVTKPGCPPCSRMRGWGPEWDGDLCNKGYNIVTNQTFNETLSKHQQILKPTDLVIDAITEPIHETQEILHNTVEKVKEWESSFEDTLQTFVLIVEILVFSIIFALVAYFCFRLCRCCYATCKCMKKSCQPKAVV